MINSRKRCQRKGILTFEWILLLSLLVIGVATGLAAIRDTYIIKAADSADAMLHVNKYYQLTPSPRGTQVAIINGEDFALPVSESEGSQYSSLVRENGQPMVTVTPPAGTP